MQQQQLRFYPNRRIVAEPYPMPQPNANQVLVRVTHTAISAGSEMNFVRHGPQAYGIEPKPDDTSYNIGYMAAGEVAKMGEGVSHVYVGERVLTGGTHASHCLVDLAKAGSILDPIPEGLDTGTACFAILGDVALHGVRRANLQIDQSVAVFGMGMVGQLTLQLARLSGAYPLIAVDLDDERLKIAKATGASHIINANRESADVRIREITSQMGRATGAEVVFHCTQVPHILQSLLTACANRGKIVLTGSPPGTATIRLQEDLLRREITITGIYESDMNEVHPYWSFTRERNRRACLRMMAQGALQVKPLISHRVPYTQAQAMYDMMAESPSGWLGIVLEWGS
jgi:threonine dehydrogenase-like Zn-dependent dehydrogenase